MMRASIREEENITIYRFLSGLSLEIRDKVELMPYRDLMTRSNFVSKLNNKIWEKDKVVKKVLTLTLISRKSIKKSTKGRKFIEEI